MKNDLPVGTHTIEASVTDSGGLTATVQVTVTFTQTSVQTLVATIVTDKGSYINGEKVTVTVTVKDQNGAVVPSASVSVKLTPPSGTSTTYSGTTSTTGIYSFTYRINTRKTGTGTYSLLATVSKTGYVTATASTTFSVK